MGFLKLGFDRRPIGSAELGRFMRTLAWVVLPLASSAVYAAAGLGGSVGAGIERSDNVFRTGTKGVGGNIALLFLDTNAAVDRSNLLFGLSTNLNYRDYLSQDIPSQLTGGALANLTYKLLGDHLELGGIDRYGWVRQIDPVTGTQSYQKYNDVTGSGLVNVPIGSRTAIIAQDQFSTVTNGSANIQNDRNKASVTIRQRLSTITSVFVVASREAVRFAKLSNDFNYDIDEIAAGFTANLQRTNFDVLAGRTKVSGRIEDIPGSSLLRASVAKKIGSRLKIQLDAGNVYSNYSRNFVAVQDVAGVDQESLALTATADPFKSIYGDVIVTWSGVRNTYSLMYRQSKEKHQLQPLADSTQTLAEFNMAHQFSGKVSAYLRAGYTDFAKNGQIENFYDLQVRGGVTMSITQALSLETYVDSYSGTATQGDYRERRVGISLAYQMR